MQKIMFDDNFGLTAAVLSGRKTMTRRIISQEQKIKIREAEGDDPKQWVTHARYWPGDRVAVAQSYQAIHEEMMKGDYGDGIYDAFRWADVADTRGWKNKMFVRADLMPHQIQILDVQVKRLQNITDDDCIKEGIEKVMGSYVPLSRHPGCKTMYPFPADAFAALIDKLSGAGTWKRDPWCFVYTFKLIR
jgi:hypothetical protein